MRIDDAANASAKDPVLRGDLKRSMFDLLEDVRLAVGTMNVDVARGLVDERLVPHRSERLPHIHEVHDRGRVRERLDVEVASVEPAADVQPGDALSGRESRLGRGPHAVAVEVPNVHRRLQRIVHVGDAMPYTVSLVH